MSCNRSAKRRERPGVSIEFVALLLLHLVAIGAILAALF